MVARAASSARAAVRAAKGEGPGTTRRGAVSTSSQQDYSDARPSVEDHCSISPRQPAAAKCSNISCGAPAGRWSNDQSGGDDTFAIARPNAEDILYQTMIFKHQSSITDAWTRRYAVLTKDCLLILHERSGPVREYIGLVDMDAIEEESRDFVPGKTFNFGKPTCTMDFEQLLASQGSSAENTFVIHSKRLGRSFRFRTETSEGLHLWLEYLKNARSEATRLESAAASQIERARHNLSIKMKSAPWQIVSASILVGNFISNILSTEWLAHHTIHGEPPIFDHLDLFVTVFCAVEITLCLWCDWFWPFFMNYWNLFDLIIVLFSVIEAIAVEYELMSDHNLSMMRTVRCFRVLRIFARFKTINRIINAIISTALPVFNTFVILFILMAMYSILGTRFFFEAHPTRFGSFTSSFLTMLQVATLDSWSGDVMRPLFREITTDEMTGHTIVPAYNEREWGTAIFFVSYVVMVSIVFINVIVAVLLEGFMSSMQNNDNQRVQREQLLALQHSAGPIDPLLERLSGFTCEADLCARIDGLFTRFDVDDSGFLSYHELRMGFASLGLTSDMIFSQDDFAFLTNAYTIGENNSRDGWVLNQDAFNTAIRIQLSNYAARLLSQRMRHSAETFQGDESLLLALKLMMAEGKRRHTTTFRATPQGQMEKRSRPGPSVAGDEESALATFAETKDDSQVMTAASDVFLDTSPACEKSHDLPQLNRALTSWEILEGGGGEDETVHTRIDRLHAALGTVISKQDFMLEKQISMLEAVLKGKVLQGDDIREYLGAPETPAVDNRHGGGHTIFGSGQPASALKPVRKGLLRPSITFSSRSPAAASTVPAWESTPRTGRLRSRSGLYSPPSTSDTKTPPSSRSLSPIADSAGFVKLSNPSQPVKPPRHLSEHESKHEVVEGSGGIVPASQLTFNLLKHIMGSRDEVSSIDPRGESGDQNASMLRRHLSPRGQRSRMNTSDDWNVTNGLQGASSFQNIVPFSGPESTTPRPLSAREGSHWTKAERRSVVVNTPRNGDQRQDSRMS